MPGGQLPPKPLAVRQESFQYLQTQVTDHLLLAHSCRILALVMDKDPLAYTIPENVTVFCGDLTDKDM